MSVDIFVSYRRDDCAAEAGRLQSSLAKEIGDQKIFFDTCSIEAGEIWPARLEGALRSAKIFVVVIGSGWLKISDEWGRRRIDQSGDWVRKELECAIENQKHIIPVLVSGALLPPSTDLLPQSISTLLNYQALEIRLPYWEHDVLLLVQRIKDLIAMGKSARPKYYPGMQLSEYPEPIKFDALNRIIKEELVDWEVIRSQSPEASNGVKEELYKMYEFQNFKQAIGFMTQVAQGCDLFEHHPRWENIWNKVSVYLSTWGSGYKITDRDVRLARHLDKSYKKYPGSVIRQ